MEIIFQGGRNDMKSLNVLAKPLDIGDEQNKFEVFMVEKYGFHNVGVYPVFPREKA